MIKLPLKIRKGSLVILLLLLAGAGAAAYMLGAPIPGFTHEKPENNAPSEPSRLKVHLVKDVPHTLLIPEEVCASLGIHKGGKESVAVAEMPKSKRPLVLSARTLFDPGSTYRVYARFAPADVVRVEKSERNATYTPEGAKYPDLRSGDYVVKDQPLAVLYSVDVGSKKNDLIDALVQYKTDKELLDGAEGSIAIPHALLLTYERNVRADLNAIKRSLKYLEGWKIEPEDIEAVYKEADAIFKSHVKGDFNAKKYDPDKEDKWGQVVLKAPESGFIVERNVSKGIVIDPTIALFQIAKADKLQVMADAYEEAVKEIYEEWKKSGLNWTIRPLGVPDADGIPGVIDEIGMLVDPNQKTVPIKGIIDNAGGVLRAGQYVTATIKLPPPKNVVEIPANAIADDGKQAIVFVQPDEKKPEYTMRRVMITHRFKDRVFVRSELTEKEKELSPEEKDQGLMPKAPLQLGERVITAGLLELKKELEDLESEKGE